MKRRNTLCFVLLLITYLSWIFALQAQMPQPSQAVSNSTNGVEKESKLEEGTTTTTRNGNEEEEEENYRELSRLGSRPPNCGHKCGGCFPCEAVQIPTTTDRLSLQIANYEPEGWKCKCGLSFFNP